MVRVSHELIKQFNCLNLLQVNLNKALREVVSVQCQEQRREPHKNAQKVNKYNK